MGCVNITTTTTTAAGDSTLASNSDSDSSEETYAPTAEKAAAKLDTRGVANVSVRSTSTHG